MKKYLSIVLICLLMVCCLTACGEDEPKQVSDEVLKVDDITVTYGAFHYTYNILLDQMINSNVNVDEPGVVSYLKQQAYDTLMQMAKGRSYCEQQGVVLSTAESQAAIDKQKKDLPETAWNIHLQSYFMNEADLLWVMHTSSYSSEFSKLLSKDLQMTPEEAKAIYEKNPAAYDKYKVSHILIAYENAIGRPTQSQIEDARAAAAEVIEKLNNGADWNEMVKQYSDDTYTIETGGVLDYEFTAENSTYVKEFTEGAIKLTKVGEYSQEPVISNYGAHIIKLDYLLSGFENLEQSIMDQIGQEKANELFDEWMADENFEIVENEEFKQFLLTDEMEWTPYTQQFDEE